MLESIVTAYLVVLFLVIGILVPAGLLASAVIIENVTWWQRILMVASAPLFLGIGIHLARGLS